MKIFPICKTLINIRTRRSPKIAFCSNSVQFSKEEKENVSFNKRKSMAESIGFLTGIIGLGLGLLWIADRLKKTKW